MMDIVDGTGNALRKCRCLETSLFLLSETKCGADEFLETLCDACAEITRTLQEVASQADALRDAMAKD